MGSNIIINNYKANEVFSELIESRRPDRIEGSLEQAIKDITLLKFGYEFYENKP